MHLLGLVSISFRSLTPEQVLSAISEAGLSCVEWGSDVHAPCKDVERLHRIAALQKEMGIHCCSYGTYFRIGANTAEELRPYIRAAKILGTNIIRLWCGAKGSADFSQGELETFYDICGELAKIAQQENVILCMECHNGTMTDSARAALELMQAVNSPAFQMYWQPNQFRTIEENLEYIQLLKPYVHRIHVFQWKGSDRFPLEDGEEEWRQYLSAFGTEQTLLLEFMPDDRVETLPREAATLRKIAE